MVRQNTWTRNTMHLPANLLLDLAGFIDGREKPTAKEPGLETTSFGLSRPKSAEIGRSRLFFFFSSRTSHCHSNTHACHCNRPHGVAPRSTTWGEDDTTVNYPESSGVSVCTKTKHLNHLFTTYELPSSLGHVMLEAIASRLEAIIFVQCVSFSFRSSTWVTSCSMFRFPLQTHPSTNSKVDALPSADSSSAEVDCWKLTRVEWVLSGQSIISNSIWFVPIVPYVRVHIEQS